MTLVAIILRRCNLNDARGYNIKKIELNDASGYNIKK